MVFMRIFGRSERQDVSKLQQKQAILTIFSFLETNFVMKRAKTKNVNHLSASNR